MMHDESIERASAEKSIAKCKSYKLFEAIDFLPIVSLFPGLPRPFGARKNELFLSTTFLQQKNSCHVNIGIIIITIFYNFVYRTLKNSVFASPEGAWQSRRCICCLYSRYAYVK